MDAKYNMFATSAMPKDSVSRNLDFTYEDNVVKQINQNSGMVHRNRFEYDFQKKQGYLRDLSKEKKNNNFSKLLLTPDNRQRKLGYVHQSREDSIDRSSKRGVGIGF